MLGVAHVEAGAVCEQALIISASIGITKRICHITIHHLLRYKNWRSDIPTASSSGSLLEQGVDLVVSFLKGINSWLLTQPNAFHHGVHDWPDL